MDFAAQLNAIKQLLSRGELEQALGLLIPLLEQKGPTAAEFTQIARVNQADFFRLKSDQLRGTVSADDARLITNQLTASALSIVNDLLAGRTQPGGQSNEPSRSQAWRYYLAGGIVTLALALLAWRIWGGKDEQPDNGCPGWGKNAGMCVMVLPFKHTGGDKSAKPEFEISDGLNDLIQASPGMKAIADVHERYDIDKNYPNPVEAAEIARNCNAQMIVWGRINQSAGKSYSLDVRYKLLDAGGVRYSGDTTISRLLTVTDEGRWIQDVESVTRLLYFVLANQLRTPIAANFQLQNKDAEKSIPDSAGLVSASKTTVDTSTGLTMADYYIRTQQTREALAELDKILDTYPNHQDALLKRGALRYAMGDYPGAANDLEGVSAQTRSTLPALYEVRADAYLKSGQPDKADHELDKLIKEGTKDNTWLDQKKREVRDSSLALSTRLEKIEKLANQRPTDKKARLDAARASLGIGDADRALSNANKVIRQDPANVAAIQQAVEAQLMKGDTAAAQKTIQQAEKSGVNVKSIDWKPVVRPLIKE